MTLITNQQTLEIYLPNQLETVEGEHSLFTKITPWLKEAELWIEQYICHIGMINEQDQTFNLLQNIAALHAFALAIPSLDLILTPNGFGIVSNANVAPASKDRVERLVKSLIKQRNNILQHTLHILQDNPTWHETIQAKFWQKTLWQDLSIAAIVKDILSDKPNDDFKTYINIQPTIRAIETSVAMDVVSIELMQQLRQQICRPDKTESVSKLASLVKMLVYKILVAELKGKTIFCKNDCALIADFIKKNVTDFADWTQSQQAALWLNPDTFENTKEAHGYFF